MLKASRRVNRTPKKADSNRQDPPTNAKILAQKSENRRDAFNNAGKRANREDLYSFDKSGQSCCKATNWGDVQQKPQKSVIRVARSNKTVISGRVGKISKSKAHG